jgi:hypothetical protein
MHGFLLVRVRAHPYLPEICSWLHNCQFSFDAEMPPSMRKVSVVWWVGRVAYFLWACMEWHSIPAGMEWSFLLEWNGSFHSSRNGMAVIHSSRNGMSHFSPAGMEWPCSFLQDWNLKIPYQGNQFHNLLCYK